MMGELDRVSRHMAIILYILQEKDKADSIILSIIRILMEC